MTFILTTTIIWVVVLFMILPISVSVSHSHGPGHATSAPEKPHIGLKLLASVVISMILALCWIVGSRYLL